MRPPLFILAPPRSFTSVTCAMLGGHPEMFGAAEINLFCGDTIAELNELFKNRQRSKHGVLRILSELAFAEQSEETVEAARRWLVDNAGIETIELYRTIQEWIDGRVLIDKSPIHVFLPEALPRIASHLPEARYLHLTRHPGDTIKSLLQLQQKFGDAVRERLRNMPARQADRVDPEAPNKYWLKPHLRILEFLETIPVAQKMRVRGEDLLSDPANYLRQIAEWLDVRTDPEAIDAMLHPENSPFSKPGPKNARFGNDPNFMEQPQLRPYHYTPRPLEWTPADGTPRQLDETVRAYAMIFGY